MSTTITTAANEYFRRPADERYPSVDAMIEAAQLDKDQSVERTYNLRDLKAAVDHNDRVVLAGPRGTARLTHWSFGQLSSMIGAPAAYLRELPAELAARNINHGLHEAAPVGSTASLLLRAGSNGESQPIARSITSESYGRLWDAQLYGAIKQSIMSNDSRWQTPPTWTGEPAGAYRGDRDSFLILVNGGSIVTDPSLRSATGGSGNGQTDGLYRGIMVRNSEVGGGSVVFDSVLYRFICGNHMLWGAVIDRKFKRRHVGTKVLRDTLREINTFAWQFTQRSAAADEAIIRSLVTNEIAHTREAVIDELRKLGATKVVAEAAYARAEATETVSPRTFWGVANGLTRLSQDSGYQDGRYELDQLAAIVMARGARLVAA